MFEETLSTLVDPSLFSFVEELELLEDSPFVGVLLFEDWDVDVVEEEEEGSVFLGGVVVWGGWTLVSLFLDSGTVFLIGVLVGVFG